MSGKTKRKAEWKMKRLKFTKAILILVCTASLAGCGNIQKDTGTDAPSYSQNPEGGQSTNTSTEAQSLLDSAVLIGSVTDFQEGSFQVMADRTEDNGQTAVGAAPGMESESGMESTTVSYGEDCVFQIANIDINTQAVNLEDASSSDVKKSTSVAVYGETQENGEIHAAKVLITRFQ